MPRSGPDPVRLNLVLVSEVSGKLLVFSDSPPMVYEVDPLAEKITRDVALPYKPSGAVFNSGGDRLYVTAGGPQGRILEIDPVTLRVVKDFSSGGHTPVAPILSADERSLFVCNRFSIEVVQLDLGRRRILKRFGVLREPVALVPAPGGRYLFAGNFLPAGRSDAEHVSVAVSVIDLINGEVNNIDLPNGSNSIGGMAISPDGMYIYLSHILARFQLPTTQLERGWMDTNALSVIDVKGKRLIASVLRPYLVKNNLSKAALRGKAIFDREGCISCHPAPLYTDLKSYYLGTGRGVDEGKAFDTPTLIEAWRTGPYMHDGSIVDMEELIRVHNPYGTSALSETELAELVEFVLSL